MGVSKTNTVHVTCHSISLYLVILTQRNAKLHRRPSTSQLLIESPGCEHNVTDKIQENI